jgi:hypothetical protein
LVLFLNKKTLVVVFLFKNDSKFWGPTRAQPKKIQVFEF